MTRIIFNSDGLPSGLAEEKRRKLWRDLYADLYGTPNVHFLDDRPFRANFVFTSFNSVTVGQCDGTINHVKRTAQETAADLQPMCYVAVNRSATRLSYQAQGGEITLGNNDLTLISSEEVLQAHFDPDASRYDLVALPRGLLQQRLGSIGDLLYQPIDPQQPAAQLLRRYIDILTVTEGLNERPALAAHVETTLVDLVSLMFATGDAAKMAERGLRAARVQAILAEIKAGFSDPAFSPAIVAHKLGLSMRYVQDLLTESGASFTERVLELRLAKAQAMLAQQRFDGMKVSDIAYTCGFNEVSYFNRRFRARFGCSPTEYRGANGKAK
jgi:AraC-like DNA-binding protein